MMEIDWRDRALGNREQGPPAFVGTAAATVLAVALVARLAFIGIFHNLDWEPDGYQHVIIAKAVFAHMPDSLWLGMGVWAKPLYTYFFAALYAILPHRWPTLVITQVANTLLWTATAALTVSLAGGIFRRRSTPLLLSVIAAFTYVAFRASVTANTEPLGAFVFALALVAWERRRIVGALLLFGLVVCIRTDGLFCVVVFALFALANPAMARRAGWWRTLLLRGGAFAFPLLVWDLVGFAWTGSPLFVLSHGYPPVIGKYGTGGFFDYFVQFLHFDTVLFIAFLAGAALVLAGRVPPRANPVVRPAAVAALTYFTAMTLLWWFGAFGSAGLLRYFVFCYPAMILVAGAAFDALPGGRPGRSFANAAVALLSLAVVSQLHWLVRQPRIDHAQFTRVPESAMRDLPKLDLPWKAKDVYSDSPDVTYYLGHDVVYQTSHPLTAVKRPETRGIFVFTPDHDYGGSTGVTLRDFDGLALHKQFRGPFGETYYVYER